MQAMSKFLNWIGIEGNEHSEDYFESAGETGVFSPVRKERESEPKKAKEGKVVSIHTTTQFKLVVINPKDFDEAKDIADHLKSKKPVVINLEGIERDVAKKIVDFLSGAVYALDGNIQKVSAGIFLIAPYNVGIMGDMKAEFEKNVSFPWN